MKQSGHFQEITFSLSFVRPNEKKKKKKGKKMSQVDKMKFQEKTLYSCVKTSSFSLGDFLIPCVKVNDFVLFNLF